MNNHHNQIITETDICEILGQFSSQTVVIKNVALYRNAFVHKSFLNYEGMCEDEDIHCIFDNDLDFECNERLEFFGDSVLNLVITDYIFNKFPGKDEGFLTKLRAKMVRNTQLSELGAALGFKKWLLISIYNENIGGRDNIRMMEDCFESFIGALYKDLGFYACREFIIGVYDKYVDTHELQQKNDNYKDIILRYFHQKGWGHPQYKCIKETGSNTNKEFTTALVVNNELLKDNKILIATDKQIAQDYNIPRLDDSFYVCFSSNKTKKESQQQASKNCMAILGIPKNF